MAGVYVVSGPIYFLIRAVEVFFAAFGELVRVFGLKVSSLTWLYSIFIENFTTAFTMFTVCCFLIQLNFPKR